MEDTIEVDDQLIENTLAEPEWPWIIALAYTVRNVAPDAVATMIWALNHHADGKCAKIATGIASIHLYGLVAGETSEFDWSVIEEIERPIIQAIRRGEIASFGRNEPGSKIHQIDRTLWAGGEIVMYKTSDLKPVGDRKSKDPAFARQNPTWAYDIHVSASGVKKLVHVEPRPPAITNANNLTKRALKNPQIALMDFFTICGSRWHNGENGNQAAFIAEYEKWIKEEHRGIPQKRSTFRKWRDRWDGGYRVKDRKLTVPD